MTRDEIESIYRQKRAAAQHCDDYGAYQRRLAAAERWRAEQLAALDEEQP